MPSPSEPDPRELVRIVHPALPGQSAEVPRETLSQWAISGWSTPKEK